MQAERLLTFGPYQWNPHPGQLWRGKQEVRLTGKASAVLRCLVEHAGQIVTKEDLFQAVWPDAVVSDAALSSCIQELRQALHDNAHKPRYIETVHRRGYRFLPAVTTPVERGAWSVKRKGSPPAPSRSSLSASRLVGRDAELRQLHGWLEKALDGQRQIVFVTGEPGIGKTTLVEAFFQGLTSRVQSLESEDQQPLLSEVRTLDPRHETLDTRLRIGRGQCVEYYGMGEAYLPILEAFGRLCREEDRKEIIALLRQHAPSWLVQMPALLSPAELEELQRRTAGVTRERMLRELTEALEVITQEHPLVLVLEDLHWSDVSTLDLLSMLARRQERARLLIIGTYRPVEVLARDHPLKGIKHELQLHGQCEELALDFLTEGDVTEYLAVRFSGGAQQVVPLRSLGHLIHQRTDGNPLFMVNVTNELVAREVITQRDGQWAIQDNIADDGMRVPENLRQLIEQQLSRVTPDERKILEAASVAGAVFSAAAAAAGVEQTPEAIETHCATLVRREQFLHTQGISEWPDGTVAARYGFVHALYQEVVYEQISATRRIRLHRQIGEREEQAYGDRAKEIAAELTVHFERGRDYRRAIQYLQQAGENAVRRSANQEAVNLLTKGLELLKTLPDTSDRAQQELKLQTTLSPLLVSTKGYASPESERACTRALELCRQLGETSRLFPVQIMLFSVRIVRAEHQTARELAEQCLRLAQSVHGPTRLMLAHYSLGVSLYHSGELALAQDHLEQTIALYDPQKNNPFVSGQDFKVSSLSYAAMTLWHLGYPDQALKRSHNTLTLAQELSHPFSLALALGFAACLHQYRQEARLIQERAEAVLTLSADQGFPFWSALGTLFRGWALAEQGQGKEGIAQIHQGLAAFRATGTEWWRPYFLALLAEAYGKVGEAEQGLTALVEALARVEKTREYWYEAELYRIKGELTLAQSSVQSPAFSIQINQKAKSKSQKSENTESRPLTPDPQGEAEACFLKAIEIAQKQQAKSLELRATASLARLWQQQGKKAEAHLLLADVYGWFTEGFDTKDLQEAKALLEELGEKAKRGNGETDKG